MDLGKYRLCFTAAGFATALFAISGCAGSGIAPPIPNTYAATYLGEVFDQKAVVDPLALTVNSGGIATGTSSFEGKSSQLNGVVSLQGFANISGWGAEFIGQLSPTPAPVVSGVLSSKANGRVLFMAFQNPVALTGTNQFAGNYSGAYTDDLKPLTSKAALISVDGSGNVSGALIIRPNGDYKLATVIGTISSVKSAATAA